MRLYEVFPTKSFMLCGMLHQGPTADQLPLLLAWSCMISVFVVFIIVYGPILKEDDMLIVLLIITLLWSLDVFVYFQACFKDPGIIPAAAVSARIEETREGFKERKDAVLLWEERRDSIYHRTFAVDTFNEGKICKTCIMVRPILSSHCSQCNVCVSVSDHHCNWIANCVGSRNHREFLAFLMLTTLLLWILPLVVAIIILKNEVSLSVILLSACLIPVLLCTSIFVCSMCLLHLDLVMQGQTLKMAEKQGKLARFETWSERLHNLMEFFWTYSSRESIVPSTMIVKGTEPIVLSDCGDIS